MWLLITACALVLVVVYSVVLAWAISRMKALGDWQGDAELTFRNRSERDAEWTQWRMRIEQAVTQIAFSKDPTTLRAEVDALAGALDVMRTSNRKEFGSLWGRLGGAAEHKGNGASGDPDLQALLELQRAPAPPA